jgi:hypothetical protein
MRWTGEDSARWRKAAKDSGRMKIAVEGAGGVNGGKGRGRLERSAIVVQRADVLLQPLAHKRRRLAHDLQTETHVSRQRPET